MNCIEINKGLFKTFENILKSKDVEGIKGDVNVFGWVFHSIAAIVIDRTKG